MDFILFLIRVDSLQDIRRSDCSPISFSNPIINRRLLISLSEAIEDLSSFRMFDTFNKFLLTFDLFREVADIVRLVFSTPSKRVVFR